MFHEYGYVRVASLALKLKLLDIEFNTKEIIRNLDMAIEKKVDIALTPELSITGYTSQDYFFMKDLEDGVLDSLRELKEYSKSHDIIFIVGAPLKIDNSLYNCAFSFSSGSIIGITPKTYIPNYNEFYESRWFSSGSNLSSFHISLLGEDIPISNRLIYEAKEYHISYAIDICEDLWLVDAPSNRTTKAGALLIFNLSASNETVGKASYRRSLVRMQASKALCGYIYASSGIYESNSDILFSGHAMIAEPDGTFYENERFSLESNMIVADIDVMRIEHDRIKQKTYMHGYEENTLKTFFHITNKETILLKKYEKKPFLAHTKEALHEILDIQSFALARRIMHIGNAKMVIGISGGADSTLAFLVCMRVCEILHLPKNHVIAITMPGFGTSGRTYNNSKGLILAYGAEFREISIKDACIQHFKDIGHDSNCYDITYENSQARERTQILFDIANQEGGIVVGTGDLSELALGWATYNGDHMSNYAVNSGVPKTLVTTLIGCIRDESTGKIKEILTDILNTPISPELLPLDSNGKIKQSTENSIGPYILHDFFLYHFLRYGASIKKIYFLACITFSDEYAKEEIKAVLKVFVKRFFSQQFKRNCIPDGVKVGSIALSPRGDFRAASDASYSLFLKQVEEL